jgi:hypothetical protein
VWTDPDRRTPRCGDRSAPGRLSRLRIPCQHAAPPGNSMPTHPGAPRMCERPYRFLGYERFISVADGAERTAWRAMDGGNSETRSSSSRSRDRDCASRRGSVGGRRPGTLRRVVDGNHREHHRRCTGVRRVVPDPVHTAGSAGPQLQRHRRAELPGAAARSSRLRRRPRRHWLRGRRRASTSAASALRGSSASSRAGCPCDRGARLHRLATPRPGAGPQRRHQP